MVLNGDRPAQLGMKSGNGAPVPGRQEQDVRIRIHLVDVGREVAVIADQIRELYAFPVQLQRAGGNAPVPGDVVRFDERKQTRFQITALYVSCIVEQDELVLRFSVSAPVGIGDIQSQKDENGIVSCQLRAAREEAFLVRVLHLEGFFIEDQDRRIPIGSLANGALHARLVFLIGGCGIVHEISDVGARRIRHAHGFGGFRVRIHAYDPRQEHHEQQADAEHRAAQLPVRGRIAQQRHHPQDQERESDGADQTLRLNEDGHIRKHHIHADQRGETQQGRQHVFDRPQHGQEQRHGESVPSVHDARRHAEGRIDRQSEDDKQQDADPGFSQRAREEQAIAQHEEEPRQ